MGDFVIVAISVTPRI